MLCQKCKKTQAHPVYGERCEDCWVDMIHVPERLIGLSRRLSVAPWYDFKERRDRHWERVANKRAT